MTPKEKAVELVDNYLAVQFGDFPTTDAKKCSLIAVEEILNLDYFSVEGREYWTEVKQEIINL